MDCARESHSTLSSHRKAFSFPGGTFWVASNYCKGNMESSYFKPHWARMIFVALECLEETGITVYAIFLHG